MRRSMRSKEAGSKALDCAATVEATMARDISSSRSSIMPNVSLWLPCWPTK